MLVTNLDRVYNGEFIKVVVDLYEGDFLDIIHEGGKVSRYKLHEDFMDSCINNLNMIINNRMDLYKALEDYVQEGNLEVVLHEVNQTKLVIDKINAALSTLNNFDPANVRQVFIDFEARRIYTVNHLIDIEDIMGDAATYEFYIHGVTYFGWSSQELHSGYVSDSKIPAQPIF